MEKIKPWIASLILLPIGIFLIFNKGEFIFILDHLNLLFHEGGHGVFSLFGKFIYTLGGTLMQIIIPSLFIFYFYINHQRIGIQISLIYLAQNLMNIGVYASDASAQRLPLIGKGTYHDWTYLLGKTNLLQYDQVIGNLFYITAIIIIIFALIFPLFMKDYEETNLNLKI
ncbi:MAG: hypothetical protein ABFS12_16625 [Bacteroidota bacterium]